MTGFQSLEARAALGGFFAVSGYFATSSAAIHRGSQRSFDRAVNAAFILTRFSLYITTFFILRLPMRGDIPSYYLAEANDVLRHMLPYRDFGSSYAPLHPFLDAGLLLLWRSPLVMPLFAILVECCILPVWLRASRLVCAEPAVRIAAVLYVASPVSAQFVTVDGQDNVLIALLLGLAVLALARHRAVLSGALVACGVVLVKFLPLLFVPAFFLPIARRFRWLAGFLAALLLGYGYFALRHLPLLYTIAFENALRGANNLPYLVESVFNLTPSSAMEDGVLALALLVIVGLIARTVLGRTKSNADADTGIAFPVIIFGCVALNLALILFSKKSWPPYLVLTLFPICLLMGRGRGLRLRLACFALFNMIALITSSIWATVFSHFPAEAFHQSLAAGRIAAYVFLLTQIALIVGYAWLLVESVTAMQPDGAGLASETMNFAPSGLIENAHSQ